jgi:hypothetical protein
LPAATSSPCAVADGLEADWIAEACAKWQREHRPVRTRRCGSLTISITPDSDIQDFSFPDPGL